MNSKKKILLALGLAGVMTISAAGGVMAASENTAVDKTSYSFNTGKANIMGNGGERTFVYDESIKAERTGMSKNTDTLAESGAVSSETADAIKAYAAENPDARLDADALVEAGIITEADADAISEYAAQKHSEIHARFADKDTDDAVDDTAYAFHTGKAHYSE